MRDLVAKNGSDTVFTLADRQDSCEHEDFASGHDERVLYLRRIDDVNLPVVSRKATGRR